MREEQEDEIIWNFTTTGKYIIASAWKYFIRDGEKVTWWKLIWGSKVVPRHTFVAWLAAKARLIKWMIVYDAVCELCKCQDESIKHLFFSCSYIKGIEV